MGARLIEFSRKPSRSTPSSSAAVSFRVDMKTFPSSVNAAAIQPCTPRRRALSATEDSPIALLRRRLFGCFPHSSRPTAPTPVLKSCRLQDPATPQPLLPCSPAATLLQPFEENPTGTIGFSHAKPVISVFSTAIVQPRPCRFFPKRCCRVPLPDRLHGLSCAVMQEIKRLAYQVSETEVIRAKNQLKSCLLLHIDGSTAVAENNGRQMLTYGRVVPFQEFFARIDAVDAATVKETALKFIIDQDVAIAAMGPVGGLPEHAWFQSQVRAEQN